MGAVDPSPHSSISDHVMNVVHMSYVGNISSSIQYRYHDGQATYTQGGWGVIR